MENIFKLINNRLHNLEGIIKQHKYCIDNNIAIHQYEDNLIKVEKEYKQLNEEYNELKQYCIKRKMQQLLITVGCIKRNPTTNFDVNNWTIIGYVLYTLLYAVRI